MRRPTFARSMAVAGFAAAVLLSSPGGAQAATLDPALCAPTNTFTADVTNHYFPLPTGRVWVLTGVDEGINIGFRVAVGGTEPFYNGTVMTRVVQETEWEDTNSDGIQQPSERLIEDSTNYFAQTVPGGTVCYFGEEVFIPGAPDPNAGRWRADEPNSAPGIQMPAAPKPGMEYAQEIAPNAADRGKIVGSGSVTTPAGTFSNTVRVRESNPLEGGKGGYKVYAYDVGLVVDGSLSLCDPGINC